LHSVDLVHRHVDHNVELAGNHSRQARRKLWNYTKLHTLERGLATPVVVKGFKLDVACGIELHYLVRAGADRHLTEFLDTHLQIVCFRNNHPQRRYEAIWQVGVRDRGLNLDRFFIDSLHTRKRFRISCPRGHQGVLAPDALGGEREGHILGRHRLTIVELDAVADSEAPGEIVHPLPLRHESLAQLATL